MSETMPQKVARAIYEGRNGRGCTPWSRLSEAHQAPYLADACSAIGAMREPTIGMMAAGYRSRFLSAGAGNAEAIMLTSKHVADMAHFKAAWAAACDAALSEPTTRERRAEALSDLVEMDQDNGLL